MAYKVRLAVVGHVEWTTIVRMDRLPAVGDICRTNVVWEGPAGGGAVAAVRMAQLAGSCTLFTALGSDPEANRTQEVLRSRGVRVVAAERSGPTSRALSMVDHSGERTTLTIGERLDPAGADPLGWAELDSYNAVYFTAGDVPALRHCRRAPVLAATTRELPVVAAAEIEVELLIGSSHDPAERYDPRLLSRKPKLAVFTDGARGGRYVMASGFAGRYAAEPPPGPLADLYGVGDNFAAALTAALGAGLAAPEALRAAARCGAESVTVPGPFETRRHPAALVGR